MRGLDDPVQVIVGGVFLEAALKWKWLPLTPSYLRTQIDATSERWQSVLSCLVIAHDAEVRRPLGFDIEEPGYGLIQTLASGELSQLDHKLRILWGGCGHDVSS